MSSLPTLTDDRKPRFIQIRNPKDDRYTKIDREKGCIVAHKVSAGPYKGVPIVETLTENKGV
jgi:glutamate dehydrogenase/leucine dehydrogenase